MPGLSLVSTVVVIWQNSTMPWLGALPLAMSIREQTDSGSPTVVSGGWSRASLWMCRGRARVAGYRWMRHGNA